MSRYNLGAAGEELAGSRQQTHNLDHDLILKREVTFLGLDVIAKVTDTNVSRCI
jgi:hypothetical protein